MKDEGQGILLVQTAQLVGWFQVKRPCKGEKVFLLLTGEQGIKICLRAVLEIFFEKVNIHI